MTSELSTTAAHDAQADQVAEARERLDRPLTANERRTEALVGGSFLAGAIALSFAAPTSTPSFGVTVAALCAYLVMARIRFHVGFGFTTPTQLLLVPMLLLLPTPAVPLLVAAAIMLIRLAKVLAGRARPGTIAFAFGDSWHALGAAAVLVIGNAQTPDWGSWPWFVAAFAAQLGCDAAASMARGHLDLGERAQVRLLGWVYLVDVLLAPVGLLAATGSGENPYGFVLVLPLAGLLALFAREREERIQSVLELNSAYRGTALLLGDVVEADDEYTGSHSRAVVELVLAVSDRLGLNPQARRNAEFAALLHDVGKIRIPSEIINKPGPLTPEERVVINTHTIEGEEMLKRVGGVLGEVGSIVRSCHERFDGKGYPDGLAGDAIPLEARIICCCDAYSAMTTDRPYRAARSVDEAVAELRECAGTHFDPLVAEALIEVVELHEQALRLRDPSAPALDVRGEWVGGIVAPAMAAPYEDPQDANAASVAATAPPWSAPPSGR